mgnify:CR=1 FL=1
MSHIVTIKTQVRDLAAITTACQRLGLPVPVHGTSTIFTAQATGYAVQLPNWRYPVVCDTDTGTVHYDNYNGTWGERSMLDRFLQMYAVEKAKLEARRQGHSVTEQPLSDGSVRLSIQVGGGT